MESYTEREVFPKKIEEYGYKFNENGELRNIKTKERFLFVVKPEDRSYNQRHYEALGEVIGVYIEEQLVKRFNLIKEPIPVEPDENGFPKSRIYLSGDALDCQTLLLLIQGSGVVRPGQWARQAKRVNS
ncbi:14979_t:CDS:2 [Funneliformis mosseae]|uniref:14979_t:CDS:1 n=1 Tax=Funneliformis mosseae TaxID=27381 RepID=A0A9N8WLI8_FUNMO|nr:14979_t:CDS:2 [Funneliformis mosseae]